MLITQVVEDYKKMQIAKAGAESNLIIWKAKLEYASPMLNQQEYQDIDLSVQLAELQLKKICETIKQYGERIETFGKTFSSMQFIAWKYFYINEMSYKEVADKIGLSLLRVKEMKLELNKLMKSQEEA